MIFKDQYPGQIIIYDTKSFSWGEAILLKQACQLRDSGKSVQEITQELDSLRKKIENWYLPVNTKIWAHSNRGDTSKLRSEEEFTLLTADINGVYRADQSFSSRYEGLDYLKLHEAQEVWVSFTYDVPDDEKQYIINQLPDKHFISYFSPPFTTATLGPNSIELAIIRK